MTKNPKEKKISSLSENPIPDAIEWERDLLVAPWIKFPKSHLWKEVLPLGHLLKLKAGDILARPGDPADGVFLLRQGEVKIIAKTKSGLFRTLCSMGEESVIGDISLFSQKPYLHYIQAVSSCTLYFFSEQILTQAIIAQHPEIAIWLFRNLATKADVTSAMIEETTFYSINVRVARFLYLYAQDHSEIGPNGTRLVKISQTELAERLGAHRVTITKAMNQLRADGLLHTKPSCVFIENMDNLREMLFNTL